MVILTWDEPLPWPNRLNTLDERSDTFVYFIHCCPRIITEEFLFLNVAAEGSLLRLDSDSIFSIYTVLSMRYNSCLGSWLFSRVRT